MTLIEEFQGTDGPHGGWSELVNRSTLQKLGSLFLHTEMGDGRAVDVV